MSCCSTFMATHKCRNKNCANFSYVKCSGCKEVYYCSVECQELDYEEHFLVCDDLSAKYALKQLVPKELQKILLQIHRYTGEVVSFETFLRELQIKALETFFDTHSKYRTSIEDFMEARMKENGYTKTFDRSKLIQLIRREGNIVKQEILYNQMKRMYGPFLPSILPIL